MESKNFSQKKFDKLLLVTYLAVGDNINVFSMVIFLLNYYNEINIPFIEKNRKYLEHLYFKYDNRVKFIKYKYKIGCLDFIKNNKDIHICDCRYDYSINWDKKMRQIYTKTNLIPKKYIFSCYNKNPITNILNIDNIYTYNEKEDTKIIDISGTNFYNHIGLNKKVKFDFFNLNRNYQYENKICDQILKKYNLTKENKFNITCDTFKNMNKKYINNDHVNIDIHNLVEFPGLLIPLFSKAEEIHLVENSNCILIYFLIYSKILIYKKVYIHVYCRTDDKYHISCFKNPQLENWIFIN